MILLETNYKYTNIIVKYYSYNNYAYYVIYNIEQHEIHLKYLSHFLSNMQYGNDHKIIFLFLHYFHKRNQSLEMIVESVLYYLFVQLIVTIV